MKQWWQEGDSVVKNVPANVGDVGSTPGLGRSPGGGNGKSLQYSCLGNPMDRGGWQARAHRVAKSWIRLSKWDKCDRYLKGERSPDESMKMTQEKMPANHLPGSENVKPPSQKLTEQINGFSVNALDSQVLGTWLQEPNSGSMNYEERGLTVGCS
ncbi:unnamed protein product [Rangifer tarandus platyrhynchus]|uniref:Uncharacterized protein n=2 Tax=Rangifer tarandus platyrhynchus TaxID=3082113 RepID=A0ABN8ZPN3_RANTA|nr:unnamed protein product [Rangifer tarandus platyrhynchus]